MVLNLLELASGNVYEAKPIWFIQLKAYPNWREALAKENILKTYTKTKQNKNVSRKGENELISINQ